MVQTLREASTEDSWGAWMDRLSGACRARGKRGMATAYTDEMAHRGRNVHVVEIADAGHDLHLDQPAAWQQAVETFLATLE